MNTTTRTLLPLLVLAALPVLGWAAQDLPNTKEGPAGRQVTRVLPNQEMGLNAFDHFGANASGHTWMNAYLLALASHYVYPGEVNADTWVAFQRNFQLKLTPWGITSLEFFRAQAPFIDPQAVVMSNASTVFVVLRGTEINLGDLLTDIALPMTDIGRNAKAHSGFWGSLDAIYPDLKRAVQARLGGRRVWLAGHSLGGAMAVLCAFRLGNDGIPVQGVYTYGSPRPGDETLRRILTARFENRPIQRWVDDNDLVPLVPDNILLGYRHVGQTNNIVPEGSGFRLRLNDAERVVIGDLGKHSTKLYCQRIYGGLTDAAKALVPSPPR